LDVLENFGEKRLYTSVIQRILGITKQESLRVTEKLVNLNILITYYQVKINEKFYEGEYTAFYNIPDTVFDDDTFQDIEVDYNKNIYVFFKVNSYER